MSTALRPHTEAAQAASQDDVIREYVQRRRRGARMLLAGRFLLLLGFLVVWEIAGRNISPILLPTATNTAGAFVSLILDGTMVDAFGTSLQALVVGYVLAIVVGVLVGLLMGRYRAIENFLDIYLTVQLMTPIAAVIPLVTIAFGLSFESRVIVVFLFVVGYITVNTIAGVKSVSPDLIEMGRSFMLTGPQLFRWILLPNAGPLIMASFRLGIPRAIAGMLMAEILILAVGVGSLVTRFGAQFKTPELFATIVMIVIVAVIGGSLVLSLDSRLNRWQPKA